MTAVVVFPQPSHFTFTLVQGSCLSCLTSVIFVSFPHFVHFRMLTSLSSSKYSMHSCSPSLIMLEALGFSSNSSSRLTLGISSTISDSATLPGPGSHARGADTLRGG